MPEVQNRSAKGKAAQRDDPLSLLSDNGSAAPLDEQEQEAVIKTLHDSNQRSNYIYRALMLVMLALVEVLYLSPIPDYVRGTHPEQHLTMFFEAVHVTGTHDDLLKVPSMPIYLFLFTVQSLLLFGAAAELVDLMGLRTATGVPFPQQPHVYGTAPAFLAPFLNDIRWHPSHMGVRADSPEYRAPPVTATMPPRLLYLCLLAFASMPVPLMTFGTGSFINAAWWAITPVVLVCVCVCEHIIAKVDREARGLTGMKYNYKGA